MVEAVIAAYLPSRTILDITDRGVWIRRLFKVTLAPDEVVYLKVDHDFPASEKEAHLCRLLSAHGLPAPPVIALDTTSTLLPAPYLLQKHVGGTKLTALLPRLPAAAHAAVYRALGWFYRRLHSLEHAHAGWIAGPGVVYPRSPHEHQYAEVIVKIGRSAVEQGLLTATDHERLQRLWAENLPWLEDHRPVLCGVALPWTLYLTPAGDDWQVTKLMDLHDLLYWDPVWDLANIKYPPFGASLSPEHWQAFLAGYGAPPPDEKRLLLYLLLQRLDAAMGNYYERPSPVNVRWKTEVWRTFPHLLAGAERAV